MCGGMLSDVVRSVCGWSGKDLIASCLQSPAYLVTCISDKSRTSRIKPHSFVCETISAASANLGITTRSKGSGSLYYILLITTGKSERQELTCSSHPQRPYTVPIMNQTVVRES